MRKYRIFFVRKICVHANDYNNPPTQTRKRYSQTIQHRHPSHKPMATPSPKSLLNKEKIHLLSQSLLNDSSPKALLTVWKCPLEVISLPDRISDCPNNTEEENDEFFEYEKRSFCEVYLFFCRLQRSAVLCCNPLRTGIRFTRSVNLVCARCCRLTTREALPVLNLLHYIKRGIVRRGLF